MILTHRLFRGAGAGAASSDSPAAARTSADGFDPVAGEMERWTNLPHDHFSEFCDDDGLLNEFQMMWALRERFPLHFIVFKQTASHLGHEANVEQVFSRAGLLSDPNIDPEFLSQMVMLSVNKKWFNPLMNAIKDKYYEMFHGKGIVNDIDISDENCEN